MREALRLMDERDQWKAIQQEGLRKKIAAGIKSLDEGKGVDGEAVFARLEAELDAEILAEDERTATERGGHK